ncbi:SAM-dependent chlorinase/fluorinase [Candidatus Falkowbacteria bacterium]|nr:SAM-dependent chlorinase/fluorinase [Candidatus Falkowbacteria bacterium]
MNLTIINDCRDDNAKVRQLARAKSLIGHEAAFIGVANDLEAAGCIIDVLDAYGEAGGTIIANVAPRNGGGKRWPNGTPFAYARIGNSLVVASISGLTWSLVRKLGLARSIEVMDIPTVLKELAEAGVLDSDLIEPITKSQFRSYEFLPRVAAFLLSGGAVPSETVSLDELDQAEPAVWWADNFGNCKTSLLAQEVSFKAGSSVSTIWGELPGYERLKDVPDGEPAIIIGSSGFGSARFLELVVQGASAAQHFGVKSGQSILA